MHVFQSQLSDRHDPKLYFRRGATIAHPENVERLRVLEAALRGSGARLHEAVDLGLGVIEAVHDAGYVRFLETAWAAP